MTVQGWVYLIGAVVSWRFIAGLWYRSDPQQGPLPATFIGFCGAWVWPAVLLGWLIFQACMHWPEFMRRVFVHESRKERLRRVERDNREREEDLGL